MFHLSSTRVRIALVLAFAVATLGAGAGSLATLTDLATATWQHDVQTIALQVNGSKSVTLPASHWQNTGDKKYAALLIANTGTGEFKYDLSSSATGNDALNAALVVNAKANTNTENCNAAGWSSAGAPVILDASPDSADIPTTSARTIPPGWVERLCVQVQYSPSATAPGTAPGTAPLDWTLQFNAESTYTGQ